MSRHGLRVLGAADLPSALELLAADRVTHVFVEHRARITRLEPRWLGGEAWGWYEDGRLVSMCHAAANLVPAVTTPAALEAYAARALTMRRPPATILGPAEDVHRLWELLEPHWATPRELRWDQPHLVVTADALSDVAPDPLVRVSVEDDFEVLYPACVAMYAEEVGVSPEADAGQHLYRARVRQLIGRGWSFARYEDGRVVFKAEVACATPYAAQVQGVWVHPDRRGEGLAASGMAAVVRRVMAGIAPRVSLYVNAHNVAARRAYERVGFRQQGTFSTILF